MRTKLKAVKKLVDDADKATKTALLQRVSYSCYLIFFLLLESRVGVVVRALASHQCGPGSNPGPGVMCGLSLLLVLALL